ncbi:MAG: hypothetical protein BZ136_03300 [Methanosphaera sp. rholeuAM74]|nr:MAG: hypothetical protein BZ136_03300 [Methanosphaera sp. rholeuAM74]
MKYQEKLPLLIPAIITFIIALILIYKYTYPISWDVYYHIHMANLYADNGLVFWDYQTVAPKGRLIMYPPLFHLVFAAIHNLTSISTFQLMRISQPVMAFMSILLITYSSYKITDTKTGLITGFMAMTCFVTFNRSVIATPATLALALSLTAIVYYYHATEDNSIKDYIISALIMALISNLHMATAILTVAVTALYTLILILKRQIHWRNLLIFLVTLIVTALPWWLYITINYQLVFNSIKGSYLSVTWFLFKYYGLIPLTFTIIGYYTLYKKRSNKSVLLVVWTLALILLSQVTLLGFNTVSVRILEVASYPLIIVAAIGFTAILNSINNVKYRRILLVVFIAYASIQAVNYTDSYTPDVIAPQDNPGLIMPYNVHQSTNPKDTLLKPSIISLRYSDQQLAQDRHDVMEYFKGINDTKTVVCEDAIMDTIIASSTNMPVIYGGFTESIPEYVTDPVHIVHNMSTYNELENLNIGYILLKADTPTPYYAQLIHENNNYKICKIRESNDETQN